MAETGSLDRFSRFRENRRAKLETEMDRTANFSLPMAVKRKDASLNKILTRRNRVACHYHSLK